MKDIEMEIIKLKPEDRIIEEHTSEYEEKNDWDGWDAPQIKRTTLRRKLVFKLKKAALSHEEIAKKVRKAYEEDDGLNPEHLPDGWSARYVAQDITRYLEKYQEELMESAQEMVLVEVERIDEIINALWDRVRKVDGPAELKAIDRIIKLQERKANYLGLDDPEKIEFADRSEDGFSFGWADPDDAPSFNHQENSEE